MLSHPLAIAEIRNWLAHLLDTGRIVYIPEIADYEIRRELQRAGRIKGLRRLDRLKLTLNYLPITTEAMLKAAEFWADARRRGRPGTTDHSLDADVILAAQAAVCSTRAVVIATTNPRHLVHFVPAERWGKFGSSATVALAKAVCCPDPSSTILIAGFSIQANSLHAPRSAQTHSL
jgi:predicted nucleic acid-binding protein